MDKKLLTLICAGVLAGCGGGSGSGSGATDDSDLDGLESITGELTSLGADGWATYSMEVTGGEGASEENIYLVTKRSELIEALYGDSSSRLANTPSNEPKIIYIQGSIDLAADDDGNTMDGSAFIQGANANNNCAKYGYDDIDVFYAAYNTAYNPSSWGMANEVSGQEEYARACYQSYQKSRVLFRVGSNTSILGVGEDAEIKNGSLSLGNSGDDTGVENIVIRNINFEDAFDHFPQWDPTDTSTGRWNSQYDLIAIDNAKGVWIDHNTLSDGDRTDDLFPSPFSSPYNSKVQHHDGLLDITNAATQITVSYNHFKDHDKTSLLGGGDTPNPSRNYGPGAIDVTFHHNYWENVGQRLPRVRYGRVHVYNNYYKLNTSGTYSAGDAIVLSTAAKIYAENNVFNTDASTSKLMKASLSTSNRQKCLDGDGLANGDYLAEACDAHFYSAGNLVNGSGVNFNTVVKNQNSSLVNLLDPEDSSSFWLPNFTYSYELTPADEVREKVVASAGAGKLVSED